MLKMWRRLLSGMALWPVCISFFVCASGSAWLSAQAQTPSSGVIVAGVKPGSEAETLGLREGDVILAWSGVKARGRIESPFDLTWVELEHKPRGPVTLEGFRGPEARVWKFSVDSWGVKARPRIPERYAGRYLQANALATAGKSLEAAQILSQMASEAAADDPPWLPAWLLAHAGEVAADARQMKEAAGYYEMAAQRCPETDTSTRAQLLQELGYFSLQQTEWAKAEQAYQAALEQSQRTETRGLIAAKSLAMLALTAFFRDDPQKSRDYFARALEIQEESAPGSSALAFSLLWLGNLESDEGNISAAEQLEKRAMEIDSRMAPASPDMAEIFNTLGTLAERRGDLTTAGDSYRQTLRIGEKLGPNPNGTAAMLINLGVIEQERGDLVNAERLTQQALAMAEKNDPPMPVAAAALNNLGIVATERGDYPAARQYFDRALALKRKRNPKGLTSASTLSGLGWLALSQGDNAKARAYLEEALALQRAVVPWSSQTSETLTRLGELALRTSQIPEAEAYFRDALAITEKLAPESTGHAEVLAGLAAVELHRQKTDEAARLYERAIHVLESQTSKLGGGTDTRSGFRARHQDYYREYAALLVRQKKVESGFEVLDRSRARTLLETLATSHADIRRGVAPALLEKERSLQADIEAKSERRIHLLSNPRASEQIAGIERQISELLSQYQECEEQIRATSPGYAALTRPQPISARQVQRELLDAGTLLLEYSLGEERSYVFAVTPGSIAAFELPKRAEIEKPARHLLDLLAARNSPHRVETEAERQRLISGTEAEIGREMGNLSRMVLEPVAALLKDRRLLVVTDGALQYIPFAMLPEPSSAGSRVAAAAAPMIVNHEIVNLPSAAVLAVLREEQRSRKPASRAVAVLADPVFTKQDPRVAPAGAAKTASSPVASAVQGEMGLPPDTLSASLLTRSAGDLGLSRGGQLHLPRLLFSRQEAEAIRAVTPRGRMKVALDFDATRRAAMSPELSQYRIVHFATHGLLNSEHPEFSGLVFSLVDKNGQPQDGFLQLEDIYNLSLPADLIVLSACETGLGKEIQGEGLIGLTRGFMYAGASRVVASLWKVSDLATARLMAGFYSAMEKDGLPPAAALRAAQIALWKQKRWRSPYYWAAFQIQGEWK